MRPSAFGIVAFLLLRFVAGCADDETGSSQSGPFRSVPLPDREARLEIIEHPLDAEPSIEVNAWFHDYGTQERGACEEAVVDDCTVVRCKGLLSAEPSVRDAGIISLDVGGVAGTLALSPSAGRQSTKLMGLVPAGSAITASSAGADLPPWSVASSTPADVVLTSPALEEVTLDKAGTLPLTWTATGGGGEVVVTLSHAWSPIQGGQFPLYVTCRWDAAQGASEISGETLELLYQGYAGAPSVYFAMGIETTTESKVEDFTLVTVSSRPARTPDGQKAGVAFDYAL